MALNFQLIEKGSQKPASLNQVDVLICENILHEVPHEKYYGGSGKNRFNWFDTIGFQLANGKTLEDSEDSVRRYYQESEIWQEELSVIEKIIDFLQENYTVRSWISVGK